MTTLPLADRDTYAQLRRTIHSAGLLEKQPVYYAFVLSRTFAALAVGVLILILIPNVWLRMADAVLFALISAQLAFLAHDAGHREIFDGPGANDVVGRICINLLLGGSFAGWRDKHNQHHAHPNVEDHDPDITIKAIAFSPEQALAKRGLYRLTVRYQAFLLIPLLCFEMLSLRFVTFRALLAKRPRGMGLEVALALAHYILYFGLLWLVLPLGEAIAFVAIHYSLTGIHLGAVFAPNHKGMPILDADSQTDFLSRQILTARNLKAGAVTDFMTGGLAAQIEHHLFPTIPRNRLREASDIIRRFCAEHSIPYCETGAAESYAEVFRHLHEVSAVLRRSA
jgi:fatty acid desaturase